MAAGFIGPAFERLLGRDPHRWMKSLGNKFIETRTGPGIQIADPTAAEELLDLVIESARHKQRLLFFCSCQWPRCDGDIACHRTTVANLVLIAAMKRGIHVEVVEWPGGDPKRIELEVAPKEFTAVRKGRLSVPLGERVDLAELAGLPWSSIATLHSGENTLHRVVGPAISTTSGWVLPVLFGALDPAASLIEYEQEARKLRNEWGLKAARANLEGMSQVPVGRRMRCLEPIRGILMHGSRSNVPTLSSHEETILPAPIFAKNHDTDARSMMNGNVSLRLSRAGHRR